MIRLLLAVLLGAGVVSDCGRAQEEPQAAPVETWEAGKVVTAAVIDSWGGEESCFAVLPIDSTMQAAMIAGGSYPASGALIGFDELRCIRVLHVNLDRDTLCGEMVCNKAIAADLVDIFRELFHLSYPIERMVRIDEYGAVDEDSMRANNSSSFCYRAIAGSTKLSNHAKGMAVDINPLYNPYVKTTNGKTVIQPSTAGLYVDRKADYPYKIDENDAAYKLFVAHGFTWGGAWTSLKDYQHFEK
jgi:hypothetical protein